MLRQVVGVNVHLKPRSQAPILHPQSLERVPSLGATGPLLLPSEDGIAQAFAPGNTSTGTF